MMIPLIIVGAVLLLFGRRLFWLYVAALGFMVATQLTVDLLKGEPEWLAWAIGLGAGLVGALAAHFYRHVLVAISGFFAGGLLALNLLAAGKDHHIINWTALIIGGLVGAALMLLLVDWALILLSSLIGATVITQNIPLDQNLSTVLFFTLVVVGITLQARQLGKSPRPKPKGETK